MNIGNQLVLFCFGLLGIVGLQTNAKFQKVDIVKTVIKPGALVFDVGAHKGSKTGTYIKRGARVVCVEPQPECISVLQQQFKDKPEVIIVNKGLAAKPGRMVMMICSLAPTISTFSKDWVQNSRFAADYTWDKMIEVEMTTLDELMRIYGEPQFIKIDVEDFEYEVLCGLTKAVPCLSFEFAIEHIDSAEKCLNRLGCIDI